MKWRLQWVRTLLYCVLMCLTGRSAQLGGLGAMLLNVGSMMLTWMHCANVVHITAAMVLESWDMWVYQQAW